MNIMINRRFFSLLISKVGFLEFVNLVHLFSFLESYLDVPEMRGQVIGSLP